MEIVRDRKRKTLKIKQTKYIENMAERFGLTDAKPVYTPMDPKINLQKAKIKSELHPDNELYRSIVGSAMYAATLSRPDIMFSVCKLSRYLNEPTMAHMTQAKRVLVYLKTTKNTGITYGRKIHGIIGHNIIYGYADSFCFGSIFGCAGAAFTCSNLVLRRVGHVRFMFDRGFYLWSTRAGERAEGPRPRNAAFEFSN